MGLPARVLAFGLAAAGGCATCPERIQSALARPAEARTDVAARYGVACPDRLAVRVAGRPELSGVRPVEADGCIACGGLGRIRVDGATAGDIAESLTRLLHLSPGAVQVEVAEHASRHVLVFGPGQGVHRAVPYIGPEPVTDLLRRNGGLARGTAFHAVHVVRPHVAAGRRPELFDVDLRAILLKGDAATDVTLQPNDQIYLGETRGASVVKCLPPWLQALCPRMNDIDIPLESESQ
jgi:protein involved in polysaccharide export with SLBB domain